MTMSERANQYIPVWQFWLGVVLIVMTASTTFGTVIQRLTYTEGRVEAAEVRVTAIEKDHDAEQKELYRVLSDISARMARIETKLEERTK